MELTIFDTVLVLLTIALVVNSVFKSIQFPAIIGYILIGAFAGPHALSLVSDLKDVREIAEFGVVFLMFTIGLEFSLSRMMAMKRIVLGYGGLQVFLCSMATALIGLQFDMSLPEILVVSSIVALSSTAIVLKQLTDQNEINLKHGQKAIGILLFQDLAVIPVLIMIPQLVDVNPMGLTKEIAWACVKGVLALIIILSAGRFALRPIYHFIAQTRSLELFTLLTLLVTLASAWLTHFLGLSMALGAFLAGMMLAETEFKHQIETDIRPFKDVLLGFFFLSVGMQLNYHIIVEAWGWVALLVMALVALKAVIIFGISLGFSRNLKDSVSLGLILAHGGEFGFAILASSMSYELLRPDYAQVILCALLVSMMLAPIMITYHRVMARWVTPATNPDHPEYDTELEGAGDLEHHVIVCGYGRVGQMVGQFLEKAQVPFIALDLDAKRVKQANRAGLPVYYADASHHEILESAGLSHARAVILAFYHRHEIETVLKRIRQVNPHVPVMVRGHDEKDIHRFYQLGATEVVAEIVEASQMLASHLLMFLKINPHQVHQWVMQSQRDRYDFYRMVFKSDMEDQGEVATQGLYAVALSEQAFAIGKTLSEFELFNKELVVSAIRRGDERLVDPAMDTQLEAFDVVVVFGPFELLERIEHQLLVGK